jgi:hypothetical protein
MSIRGMATCVRERDSILTQMVQLTPAQIEAFNADGFLILERFLSAEEVALARRRFEPLFRGEFETGLYPDEWNWREGRDPVEVRPDHCSDRAQRGSGPPVRDAGGVAGRAHRPG